MSPRLKIDRDVIIANAEENSRYFEFMSPELRSDKEYVIAVVKHRGCQLQHASEVEI